MLGSTLPPTYIPAFVILRPTTATETTQRCLIKCAPHNRHVSLSAAGGCLWEPPQPSPVYAPSLCELVVCFSLHQGTLPFLCESGLDLRSQETLLLHLSHSCSIEGETPPWATAKPLLGYSGHIEQFGPSWATRWLWARRSPNCCSMGWWAKIMVAF